MYELDTSLFNVTPTLLAIIPFLSKIGGSKVNILFLDEITGVLDAAGN